MKKLVKRVFLVILLLILIAILILDFIFVYRLISEKQIDDVTPGIPCLDSLLEKSDVLFVIPYYDNVSIADNPEWCKKILALNKTLALHGLYHAYNEFLTDRNESYLETGIKIFEQCFNKTPNEFKPPQMAISKNNIKLIKSKMKLDGFFNQLFHKAYHCSDSGLFSNKLVDLI